MMMAHSRTEQFSNGVTVISLYLNPVGNPRSPPIEHSIFQVIKEASLLYCLPTTPLQSFFQTGMLSGPFYFTSFDFVSARNHLRLCWMDLCAALFEPSGK
jgi:hypothetical protein